MATRNSPAKSAVLELVRIRQSLAAWYRRARRDLPWRHTRDPYAIWVSEIMLQQTRVDTVIPRYGRWLARFPTVKALAKAPLDDVLAEWAGLGYYARARHLHRAACEVVEQYGGELPADVAAVRALPGVGRYTAGAILSLAFGQREPILDGNVIRVLTRLHAIDEDPHASPTQERLWALAAELVADGDPSEINQGLMELGATVCTPRRPACTACPLARQCRAHATGRSETLPAPSRPTRVVAVEQVSVALVRDDKILLARRPPTGLWGGLFELPTDERRPGESLDTAVRRVAEERVGLRFDSWQPLPVFHHVLSHRRMTFHGAYASVDRGPVRRRGYDAHRWVTLEAARSLGISRAMDRLLSKLP